MVEVNNSGKTSDEINQDLIKAELPTLDQQQKMEDLVKQAFPQYASYVGATFNYISNASYKLATAKDKDQASKEIAEDLKSKWDNFVKQREQQKQAETKTEETVGH